MLANLILRAALMIGRIVGLISAPFIIGFLIGYETVEDFLIDAMKKRMEEDRASAEQGNQ
jgi:hypothetical protein